MALIPYASAVAHHSTCHLLSLSYRRWRGFTTKFDMMAFHGPFWLKTVTGHLWPINREKEGYNPIYNLQASPLVQYCSYGLCYFVRTRYMFWHEDLCIIFGSRRMDVPQWLRRYIAVISADLLFCFYSKLGLDDGAFLGPSMKPASSYFGVVINHVNN